MMPVNRSLFSKIILASIIALLGIEGYLFYQSITSVNDIGPLPLFTQRPRPTDPTADWKTYRNEKFGFKVKYPKGWTALQSRSPEAPYLEFVSLGPAETIQSGGVFAITVRDQTREEYTQLLADDMVEQDVVVLGNENAVLVTKKHHQGGAVLKWTSVIAEHSGYLYEISAGASALYQDVFNHILSTFRFIDEKEKIDKVSLLVTAPFSISEIIVNNDGFINYKARLRKSNYAFVFDESGRVVGAQVDASGTGVKEIKDSAKVSEKQFNNLIDLITANNFFSFENDYTDKNIADAAVYAVTVKQKDKDSTQKSVRCYKSNGCPGELVNVIEAIEKLWGKDIVRIGI